jgi:hypothetical protein
LSEKSTCSPFASDVGCSQPIVTEGVICTFWASDWTKRANSTPWVWMMNCNSMKTFFHWVTVM